MPCYCNRKGHGDLRGVETESDWRFSKTTQVLVFEYPSHSGFDIKSQYNVESKCVNMGEKVWFHLHHYFSLFRSLLRRSCNNDSSLQASLAHTRAFVPLFARK